MVNSPTIINKIKYNNEVIENVSEFKYLGVILDNKMKHQNHIYQLTKKISTIAGVLRKDSKIRKLPLLQ